MLRLRDMTLGPAHIHPRPPCGDGRPRRGARPSAGDTPVRARAVRVSCRTGLVVISVMTALASTAPVLGVLFSVLRRSSLRSPPGYRGCVGARWALSLIHISEPTRLGM